MNAVAVQSSRFYAMTLTMDDFVFLSLLLQSRFLILLYLFTVCFHIIIQYKCIIPCFNTYIIILNTYSFLYYRSSFYHRQCKCTTTHTMLISLFPVHSAASYSIYYYTKKKNIYYYTNTIDKIANKKKKGEII